MDGEELRQSALRLIEAEQMLHPGDTVIVGCSGGADSVSLLHLCCCLREEYRLRGVVAAHLHHGLRGEQADGDAAFVRALAQRLGCAYEECRVDIRALAAANGTGLEETGRRERYAFFDRLADRYPQAVIATAHTRNDVAETMLFRLCRGTGLAGLGGIPAKRGRVIRPLLHCSREQVETYLAQQGLEHREDATNADPAFARNRIRGQVLPALRQINPQCDGAMLRCAGQMQQADEYLTAQAQQALDRCRTGDGEWDRAGLRALPAILRGYAFRQLLLQAGVEPESRWIDAAQQLLEAPGAVCLPQRYRMAADAQSFRLLRIKEVSPVWPEQPAAVGQTYRLGGWSIVLSEKEEKKPFVHNLFENLAIDCDKIKGKLLLRPRREGDRFSPAGRGVQKSVKALWQEAGIPVPARRVWPLLCDDAGIVFIPGFGCDRRVLPDAGSHSFLYISIKRDE